MKAYYPAGQKSGFLRALFDRTACDYDRVEWLMALGQGAKYRRDALLRAGLAQRMKVLDVAAGTGAVSREAMTITRNVVGLDPSIGMLTQLKTNLSIPVLAGTGEQLPFADKSFDFLSMGYALRHLSDLRTALAEFCRVLRPGGIVCLLEITAPTRLLPRQLARAYMRGVVPCLARLAARNSDSQLLWRYYWDTIDACVPPASVLHALAKAGFEQPRHHVELAVFSEYTGQKP